MIKDFWASLRNKEWRLPFSQRLLSVIGRFSLAEKVIFYFFVGVFFLSAFLLVWKVNQSFLVQVPDYGGSLSEGVIGSARFINPLLAVSDSDKDLTALIYSGLLKADEHGNLVPDLASSMQVSPDGLTYTFTIKDKAVFHDGSPVTADDVVFTVEKAQDPSLKSPRKSNWDGVTVSKIDDRTVEFTLHQPYSQFVDNATMGILPKHIWSKASDEEFPFSEYNTKPIGSGPYQINNITYSSSGLPSEYHLKSFNRYVLGRPYISAITIKSYADQSSLIAAYKSGDIQSLYGISPALLPEISLSKDHVVLSPLPRVFGVFFNQNIAPVFVYKEVRQALETATDKDEIVKEVLGGYGQVIDGPIPPNTLGTETEATAATSTEATRIAAAQSILTKAGWTQNAAGIFQKKDKKNTVQLAFSISTSDAPELKAAAELLQQQWQQIGAKVDVKIFEVSDLNQNIIRPRKYDSLLFGEVVGRNPDLYPFWHSSERNDPGLNIALYANLKADKALESLRTTSDPTIQSGLYNNFNQEIAADMPAVFIYSPYFIYVVPKTVQHVTVGVLNTAAERFNTITSWYTETNSVWKIFAKQ